MPRRAAILAATAVWPLLYLYRYTIPGQAFSRGVANDFVDLYYTYKLYAAVGLGPLVALTRLPGVSHTLDAAYRVFARNRLRWTGRGETCEHGACAVPGAGGGSA